MLGIAFNRGKPACAKQNSRNKKECGHAEGACVSHSHLDVCKGLLHVKKAYKQ